MRERDSLPAAAARAGLLAIALAAVAWGLASRPERPSFAVVVLDTTRWDAVSANGRVAATTPELDALAATGLRYTRAYAQAHWTLPSHATLFTGLLPSEHGVDWRAPRARQGLVMLAEVLRAAGYETLAISENPWLSDRLGMMQGFDRVVHPRQRTHEVEQAIAAWLRARPRDRPFFLFVNLMDSHPPFDLELGHPALPADATAEEVRAVVRSTARFRLCQSPPSERERAILRAQYLRGVTRGDARLGAIVRLLDGASGGGDAGGERIAGAGGPPIAIVTSDHGELLGEHGLVDHQFGLWEELVHVPLVVHGVPGAVPAVVTTPVALADAFPSVVLWAGLEVPAGLWGRPLPTSDADALRSGGSLPRAIVSEHQDPEGSAGGPAGRAMREGCSPESGLFGDARAAVAWPEKLIAVEGLPAWLFDLEVDPSEQRDLARERPARVAELSVGLPARASGVGEAAAGDEELRDGDIADRLRALGYLGGDGAAAR